MRGRPQWRGAGGEYDEVLSVALTSRIPEARAVCPALCGSIGDFARKVRTCPSIPLTRGVEVGRVFDCNPENQNRRRSIPGQPGAAASVESVTEEHVRWPIGIVEVHRAGDGSKANSLESTVPSICNGARSTGSSQGYRRAMGSRLEGARGNARDRALLRARDFGGTRVVSRGVRK